MSTSPLHPNELLRLWYANVDACIEARTRAVGMVVGVTPARRVESFGSCFFYSKEGRPLIVTARHVVEAAMTSMQTGQGAFVISRGRKEFIDISSTEFICVNEWDIAVADLSRKPQSAYSHVDFFSSTDLWSDFSIDRLIAFTGFPTSRNRTYAGREVRPYQRNLTFAKLTEQHVTEAFPFIHFPLDQKGLHTSELRASELAFPEGVHGMSGGPLIAIEGAIEHPVPRICGVGIAWRKDFHLKALRFDVVDEWLTQHADW